MPEPVLVRNQAQGPTVFEDPQSKQSFEWAGAGDPLGGDLVWVSDEVLNNPNFRRNMERGIFKIEDGSPEVMEQYQRSIMAYRQREDEATARSMAVIDQQARNDIVGIPCIGPGPAGGACGAAASIREKDMALKPPLCMMHNHLASEYVPTLHPTDVDDDGNAKTIWVRAGMSAVALPDQH